ncbi:MAG: hypothetical protein K1V90_08370 [Muribaculaceae bacterium]|jgi:hypothetical protein
MQTININLDIKEIVYDIQNKTFLTGKSRRDGANHEQVANMQANDDEENANQVLRSISMAFSNLKTKLGEYLDLARTTATNELIASDEELHLGLKMPSNYNSSTVDTLAAAAHQYVVSMAVADWFTITHKTDAPEYSSLAEVSLQIISEAVNKRSRPKRTVSTAGQ